MFKQIETRLVGWPLAVLRVCIGVLFLRSVYGKFAAGARWPEGMVAFLNHQHEAAFPFYWSFVQNVVIPHHVFFAYLIRIGELCIGLALVAGIATRFASLIGMMLIFNYLCVKGQPFWAPTNNDALFVLILFTVGAAGAGRVFGFDYILAKRFPRNWLW